jgi:hypothetical protein
MLQVDQVRSRQEEKGCLHAWSVIFHLMLLNLSLFNKCSFLLVLLCSFSPYFIYILALKQNCLWTNKYIHALETTVNQQPVSQVPRVYCREGITMTCYQIGKHEVCIHQSGYYFNLIEQSAHCSENVCAANGSQQGGQQYRDKVHSIVVENVKS